MKFTLSPLKKMLKKHWRLLLVLIVVLILSFYLYRTYYLEGNTVAEMITNKRLNDLEAAVKKNESEPEPESGTESGPECNLTTEQEETVLNDREKQAVEEITCKLIASYNEVDNNYSEVEENQGNSEENVDFSEAINRLKNLSQ